MVVDKEFTLTGVFIAVVMIATWLLGKQFGLLPATRSEKPSKRWYRTFSFRSLIAYLYARWPTPILKLGFGVIMPHLNEWGKKWLREHYHGKVLTHELAREIITLDHDIPRQDLDQIIPYERARELVLSVPLDLVAYDCSCRLARPVHCEPTRVCLIIGQPFASFTLENKPERSHRLTQEEALTLLKEEHERGHVHSAFFKEDCLNRFYVICNCCKCCCGGIEAMVKYDNPIVASSGYVPQIDAEMCSGCGICVEACSFGALALGAVAVLDWMKCMGCGVCEERCAQGCISLVRDERKGIPLDVRQLGQHSREVLVS
jgi:NAD-dependent dihydropyrimidine dehydrogenase PreA subunit